MLRSLLTIVARFAMGGCLLGAVAAQAADKPGCKNPEWSSARLAGFEIIDCQDKAWVSQELEIVGGVKTVQGRRSTVTYSLVDESKDPSNEKARRFFADQGQKFGAKLVSDPNGGWSAVMTHKTGQGEFWYFYTHGSGNDQSTGSFTLTTLQVVPLAQEVQVQATPQPLTASGEVCKDPPWLVRQFKYFKLDHCVIKDFDAVSLDLPEGQKPVAGHVLQTSYVLTDEGKNPVPFAVWKNYVTALQGIGAKLRSDPNQFNQAVLTRATPLGEFWYVYVHTDGNEESTGAYDLMTIQVGGPTPKACTLQVYGINFDFDKAVLRDDSNAVLNQLLALFQNDAAYAGEIGGHTDDVGASAYNRTLSAQRAQAVKAWLVAHGVSGGRMTTAGYGDSKPLVPNSSDENKARNRRVELKRVGCSG